jgi:hypothetical protein
MAYTVSATTLFSGLITGASIGGTQVGYTGSKATLKEAITSKDLTAGQLHAAVATLQSTKKTTLDLSLAQFTFANIAVALGQLSANVGSNGSYLLLSTAQSANVAIIFEANNEQQSKYHQWHLDTCKLSSGGEVSYDSENQGFMNLTFDCLPDANGNVGYGTLSATSVW